jgi:DNA polymerase III epsilon subunit-like protein
MNYCKLLVFDFETSGTEKEQSVNPENCEVLQLAAVVLNPRNLSITDEYQSYIKPTVPFETLEKESLSINQIKEENIKDAPDLQSVWSSFVSFVNKFNKKPGDTWMAPIACGINIKSFDIPIANRLCKKYGFVDKKKRPNIFNFRHQIDLLDFLFPWFESNNEISRYGMDYLRDYFGLPKTGAHNAITDVKQCAQIIVKFLQFHRNILDKQKPKFKGSFSGL